MALLDESADACSMRCQEHVWSDAFPKVSSENFGISK